MEETKKKNDFYSYLKENDFILKNAESYEKSSKSWDLGANGIEIKNKIKKLWWKYFISSNLNVFGYDGNILTNPLVLEASGHLKNFHDWLIDCNFCKKKYRIEEILKEEELAETLKSLSKIKNTEPTKTNFLCANCKKDNHSEIKKFNLLLKVNIKKKDDKQEEKTENNLFLRPETCQSIFSNFPSIIKKREDLCLPFGIGQIGKSFRNEMTLNHGIFRTREFEQLELEFFVSEEEEKKQWEKLVNESWDFFKKILNCKQDNIEKKKLKEEDRPHYSKDTIDFYYKFNFGWGEVCSNSLRDSYDLKNHNEKTKKNFLVKKRDKKEYEIPKVIEISFGLERLLLAVLESSYKEEKKEKNMRKVLNINPLLAPYFVAIISLDNNPKEGLSNIAEEIYQNLCSSIYFEANLVKKASIGKSYSSQDIIGTYFCVTVDYKTLEDGTVTCRNRENKEQKRINLNDIKKYLEKKYEEKWNYFFEKKQNK